MGKLVCAAVYVVRSDKFVLKRGLRCMVVGARKLNMMTKVHV